MKEIFQIFKNTYRLNKIIWRDKKGLLSSLVFIMIFISLMSFVQNGASALYINELVKIAGTGVFTNALVYSILILIVSILAPTILWKIYNYVDLLFYLYLEEKFDLSIIKKHADIDVALHENPKYNDLFNKMTEGGTWRITNFADRQMPLIQNIVEVVVASSIILYSNWLLFILLFIFTLPELISGLYYGKRVWTINMAKAEVKRRYWDAKSHFNMLPSLIELKLFQNIEHFYNIIKGLFQNFRKAETENNKKNFYYQLIATVLSQVGLSLAIVYYVIQVVNGPMLIGTLTFLLSTVRGLRQSLSNLFTNASKHYQDSLFVTDVFEFMDIKPVLVKKEKGFVLDKNITPEIFFDNVSFKYPDSNKFSLKNFTLKIPPGTKFAIVGLNGAGKTTFVKLLCRFYDPTEGKILINGHDLKEIELESWYYMLGAVFQDYSKYRFTVEEAIAVGRTGDKPIIEKVKDAARASEADEFIEKFEKGYEQMLGKKFTEGEEPSVGQWQKLALARTFYRDPRVMILDEPTSSIDAESEAKIFDKIEETSDDRTVVMISHRFSTVRKAGKIIVIKDGEKIEEGNHDELMALNGKYAELFNLQAKSYQTSDKID